MNFRLAKKDDLPQLKEMYKKIVKRMDDMDIKIWNEYYPYEMFKEDIDKKQLYLLVENKIILAAFVMSIEKDMESDLGWEEPEAQAMYINRIGVNVDYIGKGLGLLLLEEIKKITKENKLDYIRLLVVKSNTPAINLYLKAGFKQVSGIWKEDIVPGKVLYEYGFEIKV